MQAPQDREAKFSSLPSKIRTTYAAMLSAEDDAIGRVIAKLRDAKIDENTLIFFISDNGGPVMTGTTVNGSSNAPLRGSKRTTLEGGVRVPFVASWKGHLPAGKNYDQPVIQLDILPTALAAAGITGTSEKPLDGVNLLPYLRGEKSAAPHDILYWRFGEQMAIRKGDWKLVRYDAAADAEGKRSKKGKHSGGKTHGPMLYNLAADIGEENDLTEKNPEKAAELQAAWNAWNAQLVPPLWGGGGGE
jgi:arylsulfatase A-like enzyme